MRGGICHARMVSGFRPGERRDKADDEASHRASDQALAGHQCSHTDPHGGSWHTRRLERKTLLSSETAGPIRLVCSPPEKSSLGAVAAIKVGRF